GETYSLPLATSSNGQAGSQVSFSGAWFANQKHWFRALQVAAFGQGSDTRGRDVWCLRKVELLQRLHPGQVRILEPQFDRAPFALLDLGLKQRFKVVEMGVVLLPGFLGQGCELSPDRAQSQR